MDKLFEKINKQFKPTRSKYQVLPSSGSVVTS